MSHTSRTRLQSTGGLAALVIFVVVLGPGVAGDADHRSGAPERPAPTTEPAGATEGPPALYPEPLADPAQRIARARRNAADSKLIRLKAVEFDPVETGDPDFDDLLPAGPELRASFSGLGQTYLVQFESRVTADVQRGLMERGVEILSYVPNRALLVRLPAGSGDDILRSSPESRHVSPFQPGYKLDPALFHLMRDRTYSQPTVNLSVYLFRGEDPDPLAEAIEAKVETASVQLVNRNEPRSLVVGVEADHLAPLVGALLRDPSVEHVSQRPPLVLHNDNSVWIGQSYDRVNGPIEAQALDPKPYTDSATIWSQGITGAGQVVAVVDTGLEDGMCFFYDPAHPVVPQAVTPPGDLLLDPDHRKVLAVNHLALPINDIHGTFRHGTHTAGSVAGDSSANLAGPSSAGHDHGDGMAPGAKLVIEDIGNFLISTCTGAAFSFSQQGLLLQQYNAGARISTNSYGSATSSVYPTEALDVDTTVWQLEDFTIFYSAGNDGNQGLSLVSGFSACKNCISVGASETYDPVASRDPENMAAFSSRGAADGRYKPDLTAPGVGVVSSRYETTYTSDETGCFPYTDDEQDMCIPFFGGCYHVDTSDLCQAHPLTGTSMSSPTAAGLGALVRQYFADGFYPDGAADPADSRNPSAQLVKAVLLNGARNMTGVDRQDDGPLEDSPSSVQGWGRIMLDDALYFAGDSRRLRLQEVPRAEGLVTGNGMTSHFAVSSGGEPLELTLVWTDPPGSTFGGSALINDLDLVLTAPDGTVYRGNQWTTDDINTPGDKQSQPDPPGSDSLNNVEGILLASPQTGNYAVSVEGTDVPGGQGVFTQGFALVVTGDVGSCTMAAAPSGLTVTNVASLEVGLTWDAVPGAEGYELYRNSSGCTDPQSADRVISLPAGQTGYSDTAVQAATLYTYTVRAVVSAGCQTPDSNCVAATTLPPPTLTSLFPTSGINNDPTALTITGGGFREDTRVFLGIDTEPEKYELSADLINGTELQAVVPVNLLPRAYDLKVRNEDDGLEDILNDAFRVGAPIQVSTAFVANYGPLGDSDDFISIVDLESFVVTGEIPTGNDTQNVDLAIATPTEGVVASRILNSLASQVFDPSAGEILGSVSGVQNVPVGIVAHPDGSTAYLLAHYGANPGNVQVIDLATDAVIATIQVGVIWNNIPANLGSDDIEISLDGAYVYTTSSVDDTVTVIRTSDNTVVSTIPVGESPRGLAASNDGTRLYTADHDADTVTVIDTSDFTVVDTIDVGFGSTSGTKPKSMTVSPDDSTLYVGFENGGLAAIDTSTLQIVNSSIIYSHFWKLEYHERLDKLFGLRRGFPRLVRVDPQTLVQEDYIELPVPSDLDFLDPEPISLTAVVPSVSCPLGNFMVSVHGSGFQGQVRDDGGAVVQVGTRVFFGDNESADVILQDSTQLYARVPATSTGIGYVDLRVLNPNGTEAVLPNGFRYKSCGGGPHPEPQPRPCFPNFPCHIQQVP